MEGPPEHDAQLRYWRANVRLIGLLMSAGFIVTFVLIYFARSLARFEIFGLPLPFFLAARGAIAVYVLIVIVYAWRMHVHDRRLARDRESVR